MPPRTNWSAVAAILSLVVTLFTAATVFGELRGQVQRNADDIKQMQADGRTSTATLGQIDVRTARIESKLEILLPSSALKQPETK